jgi:hypothetical protein
MELGSSSLVQIPLFNIRKVRIGPSVKEAPSVCLLSKIHPPPMLRMDSTVIRVSQIRKQRQRGLK